MRLGAFIAAFYYFVITVGISLSLHFCNGELSCFSLVPGNDSFCCHSDEHEEKPSSSDTVCSENCCSTEFITIALDADFTSKSLDFFEISAVSQSFEYPSVHQEIVSSMPTQPNATRGSPPSGNLYLIYSQFVFYG